MSEKQELLVARSAAVAAVLIAILAGIYPPGFVAAVVAFAFGLAAASFFPVIFLGIFWKRMNKEGAIAGMATGLLMTGAYIVHFKIGFSSVVLGVLAVILAIAAAILFLGTRQGGQSTPALIYSAGGLAVLGFLGLIGVLPDIAMGSSDQWFLGISPEGFGTVGMFASFAVATAVALATKVPPQDVQDMVEEIRIPSIHAHPVHGDAPAE